MYRPFSTGAAAFIGGLFYRPDGRSVFSSDGTIRAFTGSSLRVGSIEPLDLCLFQPE